MATLFLTRIQALNPQQLVILGSTGSIGEQALEIIRAHPGLFKLTAISCNNNWQKLAAQIREFKPDIALLCKEEGMEQLKEGTKGCPTKLLSTDEALIELATLGKADIILNALVGFAGFEPTVAALKAGKRVALANKESLVVGGSYIQQIIKEGQGELIPVDSEHSAMLQCLAGESKDSIKKIIITASGGPFLNRKHSEMENITVEDALNHPNWSMGAKITVDSATLMNKGLEIIEAHWLFGLSFSQIGAVIHPQSIVHSIVEFIDGSAKAQLGPPTMKVPILYALSYPNRLPLQVPTLDWNEALSLTFKPIDHQKFPCLNLALNAAQKGGYATAVLNASNEIAVQRFLNKEIPYIRIPAIIEKCLETIDSNSEMSLNSLKEVDYESRKLAQQI